MAGAVVETSGSRALPCLDYWLYVDGGAGRLSVEGWSLRDVPVPLTGDGDVDGPFVAAEFARILQVPAPAYEPG